MPSLLLLRMLLFCGFILNLATSVMTTTLPPPPPIPNDDHDGNERETCGKLNQIFASSMPETDGGDDKLAPCQCFLDHPSSPNMANEQKQNAIWIGCSGQSMPSVFRALNAPNETVRTSRLVIWNSLLNILPEGIFRKILPKTLAIQHSGLSVFRNGSLRQIGKHIKHLKLSHNILRSLDAAIFNDLPSLEKLDISDNKLDKLVPRNFAPLKSIHSLILSGNHLRNIEAGTFEGLDSLRVLDLSRNEIITIRRGAFRGLTNLRELYLQQNELSSIDWTEISELQHLEILDLSANELHQVEFIGLAQLTRLSLDNNSMDMDTDDLILKDLPSLKVLSIDNNGLEVIRRDFLRSVHSDQLRSLSLANNQISQIESGAFSALNSLVTLSLQNNQLTSIANLTRSEEGNEKHSLLPRLRNLYLSENRIQKVEKELNMLKGLELVALDNNEINETHPNAFEGLRLKKLFLNANNLSHLPEGVFRDMNESLVAIDLSNNSWPCTCDQEWLGNWFLAVGDAHIGADSAIVCLKSLELECRRLARWITHLAVLLAFLTVITLFCIVCTLFLEWRQRAAIELATKTAAAHPPTFMDFLLRRVPSDQDELLPEGKASGGKLLFPNPLLTSLDEEEDEEEKSGGNEENPKNGEAEQDRTQQKPQKKRMVPAPFVWKRENSSSQSQQQKKVTFTGI